MMASLSCWGMSPCIADTVKLLLRILSVSQSTCTKRQLCLTQTINHGMPPSSCKHITSYLSLSIAENNSLGDGQRIIKITQRIKLPFLFLNSNEELFDTLKT
jgi:hypothetical protein